MPGARQDSIPSSWGSVSQVFVNLTMPRRALQAHRGLPGVGRAPPRLPKGAVGRPHPSRMNEVARTVTADAAYDTVGVYETAGARGATVVIPPARTANVSGHGPRSPARDRTITLVKQLRRRQWQKASGYHRQGRVENTFFRYKSIIGDGLRARSPAGQGSEVVLGCEILNRMTTLGRPVSYRIGRLGSCRWASCGPLTIRATTPTRRRSSLAPREALTDTTCDPNDGILAVEDLGHRTQS